MEKDKKFEELKNLVIEVLAIQKDIHKIFIEIVKKEQELQEFLNKKNIKD